MDKSVLSCHPRVVNGRTQFDKVNTSAPWKPNLVTNTRVVSGRLRKNTKRLNARIRAWDATQTSVPTGKRAAYKKPGSYHK